MKLWQTRRHWEKFARTDPLWAVLTAPDKAGNRWQVDEFFATGRRETDAALAHVFAHCPALRRGHALDFGCGVGRLTQGLAAHFDHVTGIDISNRMLEHARRHNRHGGRVTYLHNDRPDLACFADNTFDFVLSLITLQHVEPQFARRYIAEFARILAPGGAALFQVPERTAGPVPVRRLSLWPATLAKRLLRALNRSAAAVPVMEMHMLAREDVRKSIQAAGATVVHVYRHDAAGADFESYNYIVRKLPHNPACVKPVSTS